MNIYTKIPRQTTHTRIEKGLYRRLKIAALKRDMQPVELLERIVKNGLAFIDGEEPDNYC